VHDEQALVGEVTDDDPHDNEGQGQVGGELGDREDPATGELHDAAPLGGAGGVPRSGHAEHQGLQRQVCAGAGAAVWGWGSRRVMWTDTSAFGRHEAGS
jgi:hypothetical protein